MNRNTLLLIGGALLLLWWMGRAGQPNAPVGETSLSDVLDPGGELLL